MKNVLHWRGTGERKDFIHMLSLYLCLYMLLEMSMCECAGFDVLCFGSRRLAEALQIDQSVDTFKSASSKYSDSLKEDARWFKF